MNGNRTAEQYAEAAEAAALRATAKAQTATNAAMEAKQAVSFIEREVGELRREMNEGFAEVAKEVRSLKGLRRDEQRTIHESLSWDDFEKTNGGTIKVVNHDKIERIVGKVVEGREQESAAEKWRAAQKVALKILQAIVLLLVGGLIKHLLWK